MFKVVSGGNLTLEEGITLSGKVARCSGETVSSVTYNTWEELNGNFTSDMENQQILVVQGDLFNGEDKNPDAKILTLDDNDRGDGKYESRWVSAWEVLESTTVSAKHNVTIAEGEDPKILDIIDDDSHRDYAKITLKNYAENWRNTGRGAYQFWAQNNRGVEGLLDNGYTGNEIGFRGQPFYVDPSDQNGSLYGWGYAINEKALWSQVPAAVARTWPNGLAGWPGMAKASAGEAMSMWLKTSGKVADTIKIYVLKEHTLNVNPELNSSSGTCGDGAECTAITKDQFTGSIDAPAGFFLQVENGGTATLSGAVLSDFRTSRDKETFLISGCSRELITCYLIATFIILTNSG